MYSTEFVIRFLEAPEEVKKCIEILLGANKTEHQKNKYVDLDALCMQIGIISFIEICRHLRESKNNIEEMSNAESLHHN